MEIKMNKSWKKIFYTISAGQVFSILGSSMVQFAIIWWLTLETKSATVLTMASLVGFLPQAILGPFIGTIVDKFKRKYIMIFADIGIALATLVLMVFFFMQKESLYLIYIVLAIRSLGSAFHMPALQASIPMIVPEDKLTVSASVTQFIQSASNIFGPALAAFMLGLYSIEYVMIVDIIGALVASLTVAFVEIPNPARSTEDTKSENMFSEISYAFKELRQYKGLFILTIIMSINAVIFIPVGSLFPLMVTQHLRGGAFHASFVEVTFAVGLLLGSVLLGVIGEKYKKSNIISFSLLGLGIALAISGLVPTNGFILFSIMSAMMGLTGPLFSGSYYVLLQNKIDPSVLGRVMGIVGSIMLFATPIGLLIAGPTSQKIGVASWFLISGILTIILAIVCKCNSHVSKIEG
jgi:DHA3 family macrolide efflux protein-like MFS transporter